MFQLIGDFFFDQDIISCELHIGREIMVPVDKQPSSLHCFKLPLKYLGRYLHLDVKAQFGLFESNAILFETMPIKTPSNNILGYKTNLQHS